MLRWYLVMSKSKVTDYCLRNAAPCVALDPYNAIVALTPRVPLSPYHSHALPSLFLSILASAMSLRIEPSLFSTLKVKPHSSYVTAFSAAVSAVVSKPLTDPAHSCQSLSSSFSMAQSKPQLLPSACRDTSFSGRVVALIHVLIHNHNA